MESQPEARWLAEVVPNAQIALRAAESTTLLEAACAGVGAVLMPRPLVGSRRLVVLDPSPKFRPKGRLWMVTHRAILKVERIQIVWRWLATILSSPPTETSGL